MIGDLVVDARLTFSKLGTPPLQIFDLGDLNVKLNVIGSDCIIATAASGASDQLLVRGRVGKLGYVMLKNMFPAILGTPGTPFVATSGGGATRYEYRVVAVQADGAYRAASPPGIITNGPAVLDAGHINYVAWDPVPDATQGYTIWRTVGGGALGIGQIAVVPSGAPLTLADPGLAGNGAAYPATSPFDYSAGFGAVSGTYPILLKGGDVHVLRWNFAVSPDIHYKAIGSPTFFAYMIVQE